MKILIGSSNPAKIEAVKNAMKELGVAGEVVTFAFKVNSDVPSKPIGYEIVRGATNRNAYLKKMAREQNLEYDFLCSIEGGFETDPNGLPFVVTYAVIEDKNGKVSTGKSLGVRLRREFYEYLRADNSLNTVIEKISGKENNKQSDGIVGFLSNGILSRGKVDKDAVISAMIPFAFKDKYDKISEELGKTREK